MLKIKDNIDLSELEKFGFDTDIDGIYERYGDDSGDIECNSVYVNENRTIWHIWCNDYTGYKEYPYEDYESAYGIEDLIQAGLVEKVEDK